MPVDDVTVCAKVLFLNQWMPCLLDARRLQERVFKVLSVEMSCLVMRTKWNNLLSKIHQEVEKEQIGCDCYYLF